MGQGIDRLRKAWPRSGAILKDECVSCFMFIDVAVGFPHSQWCSGGSLLANRFSEAPAAIRDPSIISAQLKPRTNPAPAVIYNRKILKASSPSPSPGKGGAQNIEDEKYTRVQ